MTTYAKLTESGQLQILSRIPYVSNPTEEMVAKYAKENGYKPLEETPAPGRYYNKGYVDAGEKITSEWTAWELVEAKKNALAEVQSRLDAVLDARATIPCEGFPAGIVYDRNALINASGLAAGDVFIDAADGLHTLTAENVEAITAALKEHRQGLYGATTLVRAQIAAAQDVDAVEEAIKQVEALAAN